MVSRLAAAMNAAKDTVMDSIVYRRPGRCAKAVKPAT